MYIQYIQTNFIFYYRGRMKGSDINSLGLLPDKLKTELAIHVNLETLKRVHILIFFFFYKHISMMKFFHFSI